MPTETHPIDSGRTGDEHPDGHTAELTGFCFIGIPKNRGAPQRAPMLGAFLLKGRAGRNGPRLGGRGSESRAVLGEGRAVPWVGAPSPHGAGAGSSRTLPAFLVTNKRCISAQHGTRREEMRTAAGRWERLGLRWE